RRDPLFQLRFRLAQGVQFCLWSRWLWGGDGVLFRSFFGRGGYRCCRGLRISSAFRGGSVRRRRGLELLFEPPDRGLDTVELRLLLPGRQPHQRSGVAVGAIDPVFGNIVKEGIKPVILPLRDGIVFVVVTL